MIEGMRAFVLAAGEGQRLRPLTDALPKPMLRVAGRPILEHNVRLLARHGITDVIVNLHHRPEAIVDHLGDGSALGTNISYSPEVELLGTAGALLPVRDRLRQTFLVLYGDNLSTCDLEALVRLHRRERSLATLALFHRENAAVSGVVTTDSNARITSFVEKPRGRGALRAWVSAGIVALEPEVFEFIGAPPSDFGRDVFPAMLAAGRRLHAYPMREELWWIDSPEDYARTKAQLADRTLT